MRVNLIKNGGFESSPTGEGFSTGEKIDGWRVKGKSIDVLSVWSDQGRKSVDLNGTGDFQDSRGGVKQVIDTVIGEEYTLRFSLAANPYEPGPFFPIGTLIKQLTVRVGDERQTFSVDRRLNPADGEDWLDIAWTFIATETRTDIVFRGDRDDPLSGPVIDAVSVVPTAWPDPEIVGPIA